MMKRLGLLLCAVLLPLLANAQHPQYYKMSALVRQLTQEERAARKMPARQVRKPKELCAFVRVAGNGDSTLLAHGCKSLAHFGDIYIASIPIGQLSALSASNNVSRIEANRSCSVTLDSTALHINALPVYAGNELPQAYTGLGVLVGVQDIGFDLSHPTFYSQDMSRYRIAALWDQLSTDSSSLYVGADYKGQETLLNYAHSRDGLDQTHGSHTSGIAAGSGNNSPYRGIAYESDLCLVANATTENAPLIDSTDLYKYTYATDALGFKYIFDYAKSQNKPCVVSFSEGSHQDFHGDDQLYYAVLDSLVGPGRILVASAGNESMGPTYFHKPAGTSYQGVTMQPSDKKVAFTLKADAPLRLSVSADGGDSYLLTVSTETLLASPDSALNDTVSGIGIVYISAFPNCYDTSQMAYDVVVTQTEASHLTFKVEGQQADVEYYRIKGDIISLGNDPLLNSAETSHNTLSPGSAPSVICVGATSYRTEIYTLQGEHRTANYGSDGMLATYSSIGPTFDGRMKPDVVAPGTNVISSFNSYYMENHPDAWDVMHDVKASFDWNGRTYAWNHNTGTSMSTPAVAGAIALWLQAEPTLTPDKVKEVLAQTCTHPDNSLTYPNNEYGYGQIDVYKGLLSILGIDGIEGISDHQPQALTVRPVGSGRILVQADEPLTAALTVRVYALSGQQVASYVLPKGEASYTLDLSMLPHAVYAVQVNASQKNLTGSTLIRL